MSQGYKLSFFDFESLSDNERQAIVEILTSSINQTNAVELPWNEEESKQEEELNVVQSSTNLNRHDPYLHTSRASSQCVDVAAVCVPSAYYPQPLYVYAPVPPPASHFYASPGITSASMIGSPVLTTGGYMTSMPTHMMPPQILLPPPTHGSLMLPGVMDASQTCSIVMPGPIITPAGGSVIPPSGFVPLAATNSKAVVIESVPLSNFVEQPVFSAGREVSDPVCLNKMNDKGEVLCELNAPDAALVDGNTQVRKPSVGDHNSVVDTASVLLVTGKNASCSESEAQVVNGDSVVQQTQMQKVDETLLSPAAEESSDFFHKSAVIVEPDVTCLPPANHLPTPFVGTFTLETSSMVSNSKDANQRNNKPAASQLDSHPENWQDSVALNVKEANQWPAIGQSAPAVVAVSTSCTVPKSKAAPTWASLLKDTTAATSAIIISSSDRQTTVSHKVIEPKVAQFKDVNATGHEATGSLSYDVTEKQKIGELLKQHKLSHRSVHIQPRGLTNRGNWCYVNATLQALLACPPFYHLVKLLSPVLNTLADDKSVAVMRSMAEFISSFSEKHVKFFEKQSDSAKGTMRQEIKCDAPFEPVQVYKMLQAIEYQAFKHGQQEDAEEFLSFILNRLHDEMVAVMKLAESGKKNAALNGGSVGSFVDANRSSAVESNSQFDAETLASDCSDNRWEQVRSRNRTVFNSTADSESSPISAIFRGQICSIIHQLGQKESATLQSFVTLQLDVQNENVKSVKDALEQLVSKESLQGYTCTKSKVEVDATQRLLLEELPPVLVLQLKWFSYDKNGGMLKCIKQVDFDIDLEISKDLLSSHAKAKCPASHRKYKLFAVVNHIGARAVGGHYTVDVFHAGYNCWVRCDDNNVTSVPTSSVTKFATTKVPYLIFYRRLEPS